LYQLNKRAFVYARVFRARRQASAIVAKKTWGSELGLLR
jgi:hypothetical protein